MLVPHEVPLGAMPVIRQTDVPVVHEVAPVLHLVPGKHA